ncbi:hypothetical protein [Acinetobacter larvae]|uniref:hypothetical protein n=1 Tax=Acinetobacter larvae TaxID=1789224 RepID=UPI001E44E7EB|nr:hypothetical protein [Acinetobacter larvae]
MAEIMMVIIALLGIISLIFNFLVYVVKAMSKVSIRKIIPPSIEDLPMMILKNNKQKID